MEAQSEQMQASIETMFFSVRELLIYGTGYRLLWWRPGSLEIVVEASSFNSFKKRLDDWNDVELYKLLLTPTTTTSYKLQVILEF